MNKTVWSQTDSRWSKKYYPTKNSTVGGTGCGLVACTHIAMEQERYKNWTPENLRPWMVKQGYAEVGNGTKWEGITNTLKHLGHTSVVRVYSDPMSVAWKELNKGNRIGILLFGSNYAPNGTRWSASGHYVAFTDYKVQNGKHYFYTKDSGGRGHTGWYTYENSMKGCIRKVWIVERVGKQTNGSAVVPSTSTTVTATTYKPNTAYKGSLPTSVVKNGSKGASAKAVQTFLNWAINAKLTVDGIAGAKTVSAIKVYQKTYGLTVDGIFGSASKAKAQSIINANKGKVTASTPIATTNAQKINAKALELAWAVGTPEAKYKKKGGAPNSAFKTAWKKRFPNSSYNTGCHSYVRLVLRESVDSKAMPSLTWSQILKYFRTSGKYTELKVNFTQSQLKAGDIRIHKNASGGHHIWVIVEQNGKFYRAEAVQGSSNDRYAHINTSNSGNLKKHKGDWLFRAK